MFLAPLAYVIWWPISIIGFAYVELGPIYFSYSYGGPKDRLLVVKSLADCSNGCIFDPPPTVQASAQESESRHTILPDFQTS